MKIVASEPLQAHGKHVLLLRDVELGPCLTDSSLKYRIVHYMHADVTSARTMLREGRCSNGYGCDVGRVYTLWMGK